MCSPGKYGHTYDMHSWNNPDSCGKTRCTERFCHLACPEELSGKPELLNREGQAQGLGNRKQRASRAGGSHGTKGEAAEHAAFCLRVGDMLVMPSPPIPLPGTFPAMTRRHHKKNWERNWEGAVTAPAETLLACAHQEPAASQPAAGKAGPPL